ncbi:hypothetical protein M9Y10_005706 [Tritrichomonas musculus]|uniref:DUF3447 domain-containing protein n=1 Tax=Tritrichomonas musculus TaxID=1915356 RepID=A0ABR2JCF0_9EUKA
MKMSIKEYFDQKKSIQTVLLEYIEEEKNVEENFENFLQVLKDQQVHEDYHEIKEILYLINNIANNHQRTNNFYNKIERIIEVLKKDITKILKSSEIFELFKNNKRLLLFFIEERIITLDEYIVSRITSDEFLQNKYCEYFSPEIKEFIDKYSSRNSILKEEHFIKENIKEDFYERRREGENDSYLSEIIRKQETKEFIVHVNRTNLSLDSYIETSIFETNELLMKNNKKIKIIEYAAFYGSNEIIRYMHKNGATITSNIWYYAIHSRDAELIKYLEDNEISPPEDTYESILRESIKSHHNDVSRYIINYLIDEEEMKNNIENKYEENLFRYSYEYRNYCFLPENIKHKYTFYYLCEFDYYTPVKLYLEQENIDINSTII